MNLNRETIERLAQNPENEGPLPDTSFILDNAREMKTRIDNFDNSISKNEFTNQLDRDYSQLKENFPAIFDKILNRTLEMERLEFMLKMISEIRSNKVSKHEASVVVGTELVNNIVKPNLK